MDNLQIIGWAMAAGGIALIWYLSRKAPPVDNGPFDNRHQDLPPLPRGPVTPNPASSEHWFRQSQGAPLSLAPAPSPTPVDSGFVRKPYSYDSGDLGEALAAVPNTSGRSATERQAEALRALGAVGQIDGLSLEQASALLSAKAYGEGAIYAVLGTIDGYPGERLIEAKLMCFIIRDQQLRERAMAWNKVRFSRRTTHTIPQPKRDENFIRVRAEAERLIRLHR
jgi:hypothetical protein